MPGCGRRWRDQTQPWLTGEKKLFGDRIQLTAVAGTMIFSELAASGGGAVARALALEGANRASALNGGGAAEYGQGWTDDMFMAAAVLSRSGALPGRAHDLDTAGQLLVTYAARLQRADGSSSTPRMVRSHGGAATDSPRSA